MRIVFCEDEPVIRKLIEVSLRSSLHEFRMAEDGNQGLELVRTWPPNVLVTDISMPWLDGLQLAAAVRAEAVLSELPIVFMCASVTRSGADLTAPLRPAGFLRKPFGPAALREMLESVPAR